MTTPNRPALLCVAAVLAAVFAFAATPAFAQSPWWSLTSSSRPGYMPVGGSAVNEVQEISVSATKGYFFLEDPENGKRDFYPPLFNQGPPPLPFDATHEEVQAVLESLYGAGDVQVSEGSGDTAKTHSWVTKFLSAQPTELVGTGSYAFPEAFEPPYAPLEIETSPGVTEAGSATALQITEGSFHGSHIVMTAANLGEVGANGGCVNVGAGHGSYTDEACSEKAAKPGKGEFEARTISVADKLPPGMTAESIEAVAGGSLTEPAGLEPKPECSIVTLTCTFKGVLPPFALIEVLIGVKVEGEPGAKRSEENEVSVSGGGAHGATLTRPLTVSPEPTPFGVSDYELSPENAGGGTDTQAGSHPFQVTGTLVLNQAENGEPAALTKDVTAKIPPGLIGNPTVFPRCKLSVFYNERCSPEGVLGVAMITIREPAVFAGSPDNVGTFTLPIINLEPSPGEAARFGFVLHGLTSVFIDITVGAGEDYGVRFSSSNISEISGFTRFHITLWGVPGDPAHNGVREQNGFGGPSHETEPQAFLVMPTSCQNPLYTSIEVDSWEHPLPFGERQSFAGQPMQELDGCDKLAFEPRIEAAPDGQQASKPTGLAVRVHVPQGTAVYPKVLASSNIRSITVRLPTGVTLNASGADGLEACAEGPGPGSIGFEGFHEYEPEVSLTQFARTIESPFCPNASKIATVRIKTPLLPNELDGAIYLATQDQNPFGSLVAMYVVAEDPVSGALVKLPGDVSLNPATGQIESTFEDTPQLAFEEFEAHFFGGERAPLSTPARCGTYTTEALFTPWSGNPSVTSTSSFEITSGPNGSPCPGAQLPFKPSLTGGATNLQAGAFSPFTLTMSRADGEQSLQSVEAHLPPGLSGILSNVELCPEPQANEGKCGPGSLIGETTVSVGVGSEPFTVEGGKFYLTGPYNGTGACRVGEPGCAPFGVTFEVPAKAGPFDLADTKSNHPACDCVIVRGKIEVNPETAAITITSNPPGKPDAIPTSLEGIPLEVQHVNAITTRGNFQFNPTNCSKMEVTGTIHSSEGATDTIGVPFQVTNCADLKFEPKFSVSTSAKTSRADGASLNVKLSYPSVPFGSQANIARVKVELPKQLPSRLTTLQKACTSAQFHANPAGCPTDSIVGHAKAITPLVPVPLEGPAYFVSNGGEAFPNLIVVLQGYNVTIDLVGDTFINKAGVTSSTFKTVPDQPVGSFELTLPEGKYSALAANGDLCKDKLAMPTEFVAQNGAEINQTTKIAVAGCSKQARRHTKHRSRHKRRRKR